MKGVVTIIPNVLFYEKCTEQSIMELIDLLQAYFQTSSKWRIEEVKVSEIIPLCKHVYTERLNYAKASISDCILYGIPLFYPYLVHYNTGKIHLVVPPIVEKRNQSLYLGDGMHRIYSMIELNIDKVHVLVTEECVLPLPGKPQMWKNVKHSLHQLPFQMNFENFVESGFTGYSKFCNSSIFWKNSKA